MLDLIDIKEMHDEAFQANENTRSQASNDAIFYWITQWDEASLDSSMLTYKGEFNILRKAGRQILADLMSNPVEADFEPKNSEQEDAGEFADGLYRSDSRNNSSIEAQDNAKTEMIISGYGAWELYTEKASRRIDDTNLVIRRRPIYEANNTLFWDPEDFSIDKRNARYVSKLQAFSDRGYKKLVNELTGEKIDKINPSNFTEPNESLVFPWIVTKTNRIYVVKFFHREEITEKVLTLIDPLGMVVNMWEKELESVMDELVYSGYKVQGSFDAKKYKVTQYIASGEDILDSQEINGEHIPIIPCYGEHSVVEGEEQWEGITRLAKDPSRLRNFALSYLGDITSRSPREKPIFAPEQIAGFEHLYSQSGIDNNYAYLLANRVTPDGQELPIGPIGTMPGAQIPAPLPSLIGLTREACEDVANPGIPQDIADPETSGKAILALQKRLDMQSMVYQEHYKFAKRRDAEVYISIASEVYDAPRKVTLELPDGTRKSVQSMQSIIDRQSGDIITINDINQVEFEVFTRIGPSYESQKDQTMDRIENLIAQTPAEDPMRQLLMLKLLSMTDGVAFEDIRKHARMQLVLKGVTKPETPEEEAMLKQALESQKNQPNPALILAMAEDKKGTAALLKEKRATLEVSLDAIDKKRKTDIAAFDSQTKRMSVMINAKEANANIKSKDIENFGKQVDAAGKILDIKNMRKDVRSSANS